MRRLPWLAAALGLRTGAQGDGPLRDLIAQRMAERQGGNAGLGGEFDLPGGAHVQRDIAYGPDPAERIDVYTPAKAQGAPVIFMVHGGGWARGDKGNLRSVKNKVTHWVERGYVLVSVNYRVLPDARPIEQAQDVGKALSFVQSKAASWGGDPSKVVLMGHSAGAHLIALISADPSIALSQGARPWLGSIALDSAAFDVPAIMQARHFPLYDRAFGNSDPQYWRDASPIYRMKDKLAAPMLVVCSSRRVDSCAQARAFASKASAMGGSVRVVPVDLSHAEINDLLGSPGPYTDDVGSFIRALGLP